MAKTLVINTADVAEDLRDCKPGEELIVTLRVDSVSGDNIIGSASDVEYGEYEAEPEPEMPPEKGMGKMGQMKQMGQMGQMKGRGGNRALGKAMEMQ